MKFGGPEVLQEIELPKPIPNNDQVLIKVEGASLNYADIMTRKGGYNAGGSGDVDFPIIPGLDVVGKVGFLNFWCW